ncbi:MAG: hypothetical protein WBX01_00200 [Nitrososphaeraceae archaeon]
MTLADNKIIEFLNTFRNFVVHDITNAITGKANYLAALGLSVYTEQLGGLYNGDFDNLAGNYTSFIIDYFDPLYQQQEKNAVNYINNHLNNFPKLRIKQKKPVSGLYTLIRSGLVHEYFIKGESTIFMHLANANCGILIDDNVSPKLKFIVEKYFDDFRQAFDSYYDDIVNANSGLNRSQQLKASFSDAANSLPFDPFKI